ncbi:hypothetical protein CU097_009562, partial [Rhizopus azygosporus]
RLKTVENSQIGEAELWSSFFHPLLVKILSDNDRDIRLRWPDMVASEKGQGRPDAIISEVTSGEFGASLGFGEYKTSHNEASTSIASSRCFAFKYMVRFGIAFYMANLNHEGVYTFTQLAKMEFPRSLEELPLFVNMKTISLLLQVSQCFQKHCYSQKQCLDLKTKMVQEVNHNALNSLIHGNYSDVRLCHINFK